MDGGLQRDVSHETSPQVLAPLRGVCIALLIIDTTFLILRFISVLFARKKRLGLTWDDWLLIPAYLLNVAMIGAGIVTYQKLYSWPGSPDEFILDPSISVPVMKSVFTLSQLITPAFALTRFSILALFIRIFYRPYIRRASYFLIVFVSFQVLAFNIASATQCIPTSFLWNQVYDTRVTSSGHCVNLNSLYSSFQAPEMFVDIVIIFLPLPEIWRLRSSNTRKIGLTLLFLTGFIALVANCIRQYEFVTHDVTRVTVRVNNVLNSWLLIEPSLCFIAACLPAMHPLASKVLPRRWRRTINAQRARVVKRFSQEPRLTIDDDAQRLMVSSERAATPISPSAPPRVYGYEVKAIRPSTEELETAVFPSVPLQDWRQVSSGQGVLMRQEVWVTQEDLIEDVLGL